MTDCVVVFRSGEGNNNYSNPTLCQKAVKLHLKITCVLNLWLPTCHMEVSTLKCEINHGGRSMGYNRTKCCPSFSLPPIPHSVSFWPLSSFFGLCLTWCNKFCQNFGELYCFSFTVSRQLVHHKVSSINTSECLKPFIAISYCRPPATALSCLSY